MAFLTEDVVIDRARSITKSFNKSASIILTEYASKSDQTFDVFLSHSSNEPEEILLGVKTLLEEQGLSVYIDKYSDPQLSPDKVTPETAEILRGRMRQSNILLYIHSRHSKASRWMPWELGFFDGLKGKVGVIPITSTQGGSFKGEEYLNLYPYVDRATAQNSSKECLWVNKSALEYANLIGWVKGTGEITPHSLG